MSAFRGGNLPTVAFFKKCIPISHRVVVFQDHAENKMCFWNQIKMNSDQVEPSFWMLYFLGGWNTTIFIWMIDRPWFLDPYSSTRISWNVKGRVLNLAENGVHTPSLKQFTTRVQSMDSIRKLVSNIFGIFTPKIGEDEPILTIICFRWVGSTTNQNMVFVILKITPLGLLTVTQRCLEKGANVLG